MQDYRRVQNENSFPYERWKVYFPFCSKKQTSIPFKTNNVSMCSWTSDTVSGVMENRCLLSKIGWYGADWLSHRHRWFANMMNFCHRWTRFSPDLCARSLFNQLPIVSVTIIIINNDFINTGFFAYAILTSSVHMAHTSLMRYFLRKKLKFQRLFFLFV